MKPFSRQLLSVYIPAMDNKWMHKSEQEQQVLLGTRVYYSIKEAKILFYV